MTLTETPSPASQLRGFLAKYSPELQREATAVLRKMRRLVPGAVELVYDNYNFLVIGFGPSDRPSAAVFSLALAPRWVTLCFLQHGPGIYDPHGLLRGSGKQVRSVRLTSATDLDTSPIRDLIEQAIELVAKPFDGKHRRRLVIKSISARQRPRRPAQGRRV